MKFIFNTIYTDDIKYIYIMMHKTYLKATLLFHMLLRTDSTLIMSLSGSILLRRGNHVPNNDLLNYTCHYTAPSSREPSSY